VPVEGDSKHLQGYQIWEGFTLLKGRSTPSAGEIALDFGALKISPDLMHQSVILIRSWLAIKGFYVRPSRSRSVVGGEKWD